LNFRAWLLTVRAPFLPLSAILVSLGSAAACWEGWFNLSRFLLALVGLLLTHVSVNTLNEYFDFKTGIDLHTVKTPFSGGSGVLPSGMLKPSSVLRLGLACFLLASLIGVYFLVEVGWLLLPVLVLGAFFTLSYSSLLSRLMLGEVSAGLGMGVLPVLGAYYVQAASSSLNILLASIPSGILVFNLLLLNEFPDVEADLKGGRRNLPIVLGKRRAAKIYSASLLSLYPFLILCVALGLLPAPLLLSLLTLPFAFKASASCLKNFDRLEGLMEALKMNVVVVLAFQGLMALGYLAALVLS